MKRDYDPCFLLRQNSRCGLKPPLSKAYKAGLADVGFWETGRTPEAPEHQAPHPEGAFGALGLSTLSPPHTIWHVERSPNTSRHLKSKVFLSQRRVRFPALLLGSCPALAGGCPGRGVSTECTSRQAQAWARRNQQAVRDSGGRSWDQRRSGFQPLPPIQFFFQHLCSIKYTNSPKTRDQNPCLCIPVTQYPTLISSCTWMEVSLSTTFHVKLTVC